MSAAAGSETRELAEHICSVSFDSLPGAQREHAARAILDTISATALGLIEPSSAVYRAMLGDTQRDDGVAVIDDEVTHARLIDSVAYHAAVSHQVELAPAVSRAVLHVNGIILAALSLAEQLGSSGQDLLRAVVLGCETSIRFGRALSVDPSRTEAGDHPPAFLRGWWMPAVGSSVGVATASVLLRGGDAEQLHQAWGLAVNLAPTCVVPLVTEGSTGKGVVMSGATTGGLTAADLAMAGATGLEDIVGKWMPVLSDAFDPSCLVAGLPDGFEFQWLLYKPYATVGPIFAAIEAGLAIRAQHPELDLEAITDIEVFGFTRTLRFQGPIPPPSAESARGNLAYVVAAALVRNDPGEFVIDAFGAEAMNDERVTRLGRRVRTTFEPSYEAEYPLRSAKTRVVVTLSDGTTREGFADRSAMPKYHDPSRDEIAGKLHRAAVDVPEEVRAEILDAVWRLADTPRPAPAPLALLADGWRARHTQPAHH